MKIKYFIVPIKIIVFIVLSCTGQNNAVFIPDPDFSIFENQKTLEIGNIIETKSSAFKESSDNELPEWLLTFINGGIADVEKMDIFNEKYVFIAINEGDKFAALNKWADNFSVTHDFTILAANRIEERMLLNASLFPDDEYGRFYAIFIKNVYNTEFPGAEKEEYYWIKHSIPEIYSFFILITIDKNTLQLPIRRLMSQSSTAASSTGSQATAVNRLRQTFFEGF